MQYNDVNFPCSSHHILHAASNVPLKHKFLGRRSLLVALSANHAPPPLPSHLISIDIHAEYLLGATEMNFSGAKSCEYGRWGNFQF